MSRSSQSLHLFPPHLTMMLIGLVETTGDKVNVTEVAVLPDASNVKTVLLSKQSVLLVKLTGGITWNCKNPMTLIFLVPLGSVTLTIGLASVGKTGIVWISCLCLQPNAWTE